MCSLSKRVEDEDDSDGGFKRRPKVRSSIAIDQRYSWTDAKSGAFYMPISTSSHQIASTSSIVTPCLPVRPPSVICYESSNQHRHYFQQPVPVPVPVQQSVGTKYSSSSSTTIPCTPYNCSTSPVPITYHRYIGSNVVHPISDHHRHQQQQYSSAVDSHVNLTGSIAPSSCTNVTPCDLLSSSVKGSINARGHPSNTALYSSNVSSQYRGPKLIETQRNNQSKKREEKKNRNKVDTVSLEYLSSPC